MFQSLSSTSKLAIIMLLAVASLVMVQASSHREAPLITEVPKLDGTDFYMFRSFETGQDGNIILACNYHPLQDAFGGPNYFFMDPDAAYEIHVDNNGDGIEDLTFQFRFQNLFRNVAVGARLTTVPLLALPGVANINDPNLNLVEQYTITLIRGDRRTGTKELLVNANPVAGFANTVFLKPLDNIGEKTIPDYTTYANQHIFNVQLPGGLTGRVFVGQRDDPFVVNLGQVFDSINLDPTAAPDSGLDAIALKNITAFVLEIPTGFLTNNGAVTVIGGWTSASLRQARLVNPLPLNAGSANVASNGSNAAIEGGPFVQVSRLGMPLVNEVVIGLDQKDRFNASEPKDDAQFANFVLNPSLATIINILFPGAVNAPEINRNDLVQVFLTGLAAIPNINGSTAEMQRLNVTIAPTAQGAQNRLGVLGGDLAGFPNGRRIGDDVVDAALQVVGGVLANNAAAAVLNDNAITQATDFPAVFPFMNDPFPGGVNAKK